MRLPEEQRKGPNAEDAGVALMAEGGNLRPLRSFPLDALRSALLALRWLNGTGRDAGVFEADAGERRRRR
jgi:hypothetical protein